MGTAIYTGLTGLQTHQARLDVVANNISNVNTYGYRGSRADFQDLLSATLQGGSAQTSSVLSTNPEQIGLGVTLGSINTDFGEGSLLTTGIDSDLAIEGNGFFIMSDGANYWYTRDGSFSVDANGTLVDPSTGLSVQGYMADSTGVIPSSATLGDITIPINSASIAKATGNVKFTGNLDISADTGTQVTRTLQVYDSLGTQRDITVTYTKSDPVTVNGTTYNAWTWGATYNGTDVTGLATGQTGCLLFDSTGAFYAEGAVDSSGNFTPRANLTSQKEISIPASAITDATQPTLPFEIDVDFSELTGLSGSSDVAVFSQDGYARGVLESFAVGSDGTINGVFSNGVTQVVGQVALATFANLGGLSRSGNNMFAETPSSGVAQVGVPGTGGLGKILGGELEGSNVDLSTEFSNLIITQRGYQASARTVTAADTVLQEAINLIR